MPIRLQARSKPSPHRKPAPSSLQSRTTTTQRSNPLSSQHEHEADPLRRVRLDLSYEGTEFSGWAVQPGRRTVQGELQSALAVILRVPAVALTVAGRTDAGVHAVGQVAHMDVPLAAWSEAGPRLLRSVNRVLPKDVRVHGICAAPDSFHARFGALWRRYEYRIWDGKSGPPPLRRRELLTWPRELDEIAMRAAAKKLTGLHDFAAFCRKRAGSTTVRTLQQLDVERHGDEVVFTVQADAFCHSMVRSLVGALVAVGEHRRASDWPSTLLSHDRRADEVPVVAACGLTLVQVGYPPDAELADRTRQTRAVRASISPRSPQQ